LIEEGIYISSRDDKEETGVTELLETGAKPGALSREVVSLLYQAAAVGNTNILGRFLSLCDDRGVLGRHVNPDTFAKAV
jgi:hypothetical protein